MDKDKYGERVLFCDPSDLLSNLTVALRTLVLYMSRLCSNGTIGK